MNTWKPEAGGADLLRFINRSSQQYDPEFDSAIRVKYPNWFINTADEKKSLLLAMPVGSPRPSKHKSQLGRALVSYTNETKTYDSEFDEKIRVRQPDWFEDTSEKNKQALLAMPVGCERPQLRKSHLGRALVNYTCKSSIYDSDFDREIRARQPGWFVDTVEGHKTALSQMPEGCQRPSQKKSRLGKVLCIYTNKNNKRYDLEFDREIRAKQPGWFVDTVKEKQQRLLEMPVGCKRPDGVLGQALNNYSWIKNRCFDPKFVKVIRARQPGWFRHTADNKRMLLAMPVGHSRPDYGTHEYSALYVYTNKKRTGYDPEFDSAIRAKHPDWFVNQTKEKKKQLLTMPAGCVRPSQKRHPLGLSLGRYTNKTNGGYDPAFDEAIRKKQPGWFVGIRQGADCE